MEWISMENSTFEIFIRHCGTVEKAAKILGTSHQNVSSMRNGRTWIKPGFARKIAKYLWEKMKYKIDPLDLISPLERNELKSLSLPFSDHPIKLINLSITHVKCDFSVSNLIDRDQHPLNQFRPIIIDENQQLIANPSTYFVYQQQNKKTIPAWRLSLSDLLGKKYEPAVLVQTFLACERAAIGIATKKQQFLHFHDHLVDDRSVC
jgi:transcriptional regulator with XRE-family HTH domain